MLLFQCSKKNINIIFNFVVGTFNDYKLLINDCVINSVVQTKVKYIFNNISISDVYFFSFLIKDLNSSYLMKTCMNIQFFIFSRYLNVNYIIIVMCKYLLISLRQGYKNCFIIIILFECF